MQLTCPCLNVSINIVVEDDELFNESVLKLDTIKQQLSEDAMEDPFFALCERGDIAQFLLHTENGIVEKLPALIRRRSVENIWDVRRCLICAMDAYALRSNAGGGQVLVNTKLFLRDLAVIDMLRKSPEISPVFQVILPKKGTVPLSVEMNGNGYSNGAYTTSGILSRGVLQSVQGCVSQYLTQQQEAMDERIRVYIDQQQNAFDRLKENAKSEKAILLQYIAQCGGANEADSIHSNGTLDDGFDSAVPLSPLSLASGDPSPGLAATAPLRPKAMSNPATLTSWKRKRHSGGNGMPPSLASHAEEQQDIFTFDEQETITGGQPYLATYEDADGTRDSGNGDEIDVYQELRQSLLMHGGGAFGQYGTSLPVRTPTVAARYRPVAAALAVEESTVMGDTLEWTGESKDVGASMHALALSMKGADDPERLFGERPQRRRWKTGEDRQDARQRNTTNHTARIIFANENYNRY